MNAESSRAAQHGSPLLATDAVARPDTPPESSAAFLRSPATSAGSTWALPEEDSLAEVFERQPAPRDARDDALVGTLIDVQRGAIGILTAVRRIRALPTPERKP
jgi:hypothetical protein